MKVILNKDLSTLGEEGDVKDVARGYARNYLFPRSIAVPYNEQTIRLFEARKGEIEGRKSEKREAAKGLGERLEALELSLSMPAGANGRLFGSVTSQTVVDELARQGFQIERKRVELPGTTFKSVGKYKVTIHLYENTAAEVSVSVQALVEKTPEPSSSARGRRRDEGPAAPPPEAASGPAAPPPEAAADSEPAVPPPEAVSPVEAVSSEPEPAEAGGETAADSSQG
jgi:large subunit ribosomal protein L9